MEQEDWEMKVYEIKEVPRNAVHAFMDMEQDLDVHMQTGKKIFYKLL